ncbi:MAG: SUMF1/EgtB/PvdO family nonheme iron enzyme [Thermodesulfovibrionales bacterium]|nr:SUMF1/EgtB/PvdO family nonheme iron enzyme [Thermodesulfovibrionales bacterium]
MPAGRYLYIIAATVIALFLVSKCAEMPTQPSGITGNGQKVEKPVLVPESPEPDVTETRKYEDEKKPFVLLTPLPELKEVEPPLAKEDPEALAHRPEPVLSTVGEESSGVKLEEAAGDISARISSTHGMVLVQEGCFVMGNHKEDAFEGETPAHDVCLDDFYIDMKEVVQEDYMEVTGTNPARFAGKALSMESVSWHSASRYCSLVGKRLPTEAEWEFAAHAEGIDDMWAGTAVLSDLGSYAWMRSNSSGTVHMPGELKPNAIGLYDMSGNVREWVSDWYNEHYYAGSPVNDPRGPEKGVDKVLRGGAWDDLPRYLRVSYRVRLSPDFKNSRIGFRCALDPEMAGR